MVNPTDDCTSSSKKFVPDVDKLTLESMAWARGHYNSRRYPLRFSQAQTKELETDAAEGVGLMFKTKTKKRGREDGGEKRSYDPTQVDTLTHTLVTLSLSHSLSVYVYIYIYIYIFIMYVNLKVDCSLSLLCPSPPHTHMHVLHLYFASSRVHWCPYWMSLTTNQALRNGLISTSLPTLQPFLYVHVYHT